MIHDTFTYNGEEAILKLRLNILNDHVDQFILIESPVTFSGKAKPLYFEENKDKFKEFLPKIKHFIYQEDAEIEQEAKASPLVTNEFFFRAYSQKEFIKKTLAGHDKNDIIYYGDVDEIWKPTDKNLVKLEQLSYTYFLNLRSSEPWRGTFRATLKDIMKYGINNLRATIPDTVKNSGWHFTNMGGIDELKRKLSSYDHQEVNIPAVIDNLQNAINTKTDFLGRPYKLWIDDSAWPDYLKVNENKFKKLCMDKK